MSSLHLWHGWGLHPSVWDGLKSVLAAQCEAQAGLASHGMPVHAEALPGYAGTPAPAEYTLDVLVDMMMQRVADTDRQANDTTQAQHAKPAKITLCGWSLGAMLALHAAQRYPDRIEKLILIGATPSFVQRPDWPHGMSAAALAEFSAAVASDPTLAIKRFITLFNQDDVHARAIVRQLNRILAADSQPLPGSASAPIPATALLPSSSSSSSSSSSLLPPSSPIASRAVLMAGLALLRDTDMRALVPAIPVPVLLLHGAHDPLMPLAAAEWLAATLPAAR